MKTTLGEARGGEKLKEILLESENAKEYSIDLISKISPVPTDIIQKYFTNEMRRYGRTPFCTRLWKLCYMISKSPGLPITEITRTFADSIGISEHTIKKFRLRWGIKNHSRKKKVEVEPKEIVEPDVKAPPEEQEEPVSFYAAVADALVIFAEYFRGKK